MDQQLRQLNQQDRANRRMERINNPGPRQPAAAQRRRNRMEILDPPTPEPPRNRPPQQEVGRHPGQPRNFQPRPDLIQNNDEPEPEMPDQEQRHRDEVHQRFQRLMDRVRNGPEV